MIKAEDLIRIVDYLDAHPEVYKRTVPLGEFFGLPMVVDPTMPKNTLELRDRHGLVLQRLDFPEGV